MSGTPIFEQLCQELVDEGEMERRPKVPDGPRVPDDEPVVIEPDVRLIGLEPCVIDLGPWGPDGEPHAGAPETAVQYGAWRWRLWPAQHESMTLTG